MKKDLAQSLRLLRTMKKKTNDPLKKKGIDVAIQYLQEGSRRKNPSAFFYDEKHEQGYRQAQARIPALKEMIARGRSYMGGGVFTSNMIKALKMHPWQNTVDDWQRLEEAKLYTQLKRTRRKNPTSKLPPTVKQGGKRKVGVVSFSEHETLSSFMSSPYTVATVSRASGTEKWKPWQAWPSITGARRSAKSLAERYGTRQWGVIKKHHDNIVLENTYST